jgi:Calx-beta domain-containing protein
MTMEQRLTNGVPKVMKGYRAMAICRLARAAYRALAAGMLLLSTALPALGATYYYVNWTSANVAQGTATGTITLPDLSTVTVTFAATNPDNSPGNLFGAQTSGGTNYWIPSVPYISTQVSNPPPDPDILQLAGGQNQTYTVTLSQPIKDPIMAIVSLGSPAIAITYNFNSPFTIVSQGAGFWGNGPLTQLPGNVLRGAEGHGTIQFIGTFSTFSWTVPTTETWHGFTFGIRTTTALEPNPTASIVNVAANEGNAGNTPFTFNVTLSGASASPITIDYATANGTAIAGSDYAATSGTLTFPPGVTSQPITVNVFGNTLVESDKTFFVNLTNATGATIVSAQATGTVLNDDSSAVALPIQVPTLAGWALALVVTLLGGIGVIAIRRR